MALSSDPVETLKNILEKSSKAYELDAHPWTDSLIVFASSQRGEKSGGESLGQELVIAIEKVFAQMMPRTAPRRGKRLDTRWGEFGILAALYFAPFKFGATTPASLREAWGMIDQSILYFVYGKPENELTPDERARYRLVGNEPEVASHSTLSDWHRKGLQRLVDMIVARESYLSNVLSRPAIIFPTKEKSDWRENSSLIDGGNRNLKLGQRGHWRFVLLLLGITLLGISIWGGLKAWRIYELAQLIRTDVREIRTLRNSTVPNMEKVKQAGPSLSNLRRDFESLENEVGPLLWLAPALRWSPFYGAELASTQDLVMMGDSLLASADISYQTIFPVIEDYNDTGLNPPRICGILSQAQPQLFQAQQKLKTAMEARSRLKVESFSPQIQELILENIDPIMVLMQDSLTLSLELPRLLGATDEGPKTYLLLAQNEDELRPTGGFITAAGTLLVQGGRISGLTFSNSGSLDDWSKLYPAAPWQLKQYMNSPVLILRDTNWFSNYPTAALYAEYLYSYVNAHSVDGVIAFDQQALVEILSITGPVTVADAPYPIDSKNVISYMRSAKTPTAEELASPEWNRKIFINKITQVLVTKMFSGEIDWQKFVTVLLEILDGRHLLIQLDNPAMTGLLAEHHWDGAIRPESGDFLMAVDTNVGFNKTNAVVKSNLFYDVDLTDIAKPISSLEIVHENDAKGVLVCKQWDKIRLPGEEDYPITDCYWNYLRIYTPMGTQLLNATPQYIPDGWMINKKSISAKVDTLQDEGINGVQAFGTLQVVPIGESLPTSFHFALPSTILKVAPDTNWLTYHLKVQKQPGTLSVPITIRVHLPSGSIIHATPAKAVTQNNNILFDAKLSTDVEFEITFSVP